MRSLFLFFFITVQGNLFSQTIQYKHYTTEDGLPSSVIYQVMQDKKGFLWFATDAGICRYDGVNFKTFNTDNGLPDNDVLEIHEDSKGRIWLLSFSGIPSYFYDDTIYNFSNDENYKKANINSHLTCFFEDSKRDIWLGTFWNGILKIRDKNISILNDKSLKNSGVFYIGENAQKEILVASHFGIYN